MNVAKEEYYQESAEDTTDLSDLDESEETLSLCDLHIYNDDNTEWNDFSTEAAQTSSEEHQELFQFFSEDFSTASTCPAENIIFCGKLIPYKQPPVSVETKKLNQNDTVQQHPKKRGFFQWRKTTSFNKSKTSRKFNNHINNSKSLAFPASEKCPYVSILTSPAKPRWHLLMFGLMRLPTEMELSDIKNRQHRRTSSSSLFGSFAAAAAGEEVTVGKSSSIGKGFWRLIKAFGCRTQTANAVVKASFGCIPRV